MVRSLGAAISLHSTVALDIVEAMYKNVHKNATPATFWFLLILGVWILNVNVTNNFFRLDSDHDSASSSSSGSFRALISRQPHGGDREQKKDDQHSARPDAFKDLNSATQQNQPTRTYRKIPSRKPGIQRDIVLPGDYIYYQDDSSWDSSPIVIESHKLIFFTIPKVGCTVWKQLFRRMMGYDDWMSQDYNTFQPHSPAVNGLAYLNNYSTAEASEMMTSPEWTRAMMVRNPKQRFLSAFLDKAVGNFHVHIRDRCCPDQSCIEGAQTTEGFLRLCSLCYDDHWRPQNDRVDFKYWPYIDHVGQVESAAQDARELLERIGAWDEFGASGWGRDGTLSIFGTKEASGVGMSHSTYAEWKVWQWYTPATEQLVEDFYRGDYENPLFQFKLGECLTCAS
jgi:Sulfotransferase family